MKGMLLFLANLRRVSKSNMDIASVHSDGGSEFTGALSKYCLEQGIRKTDSGRYRPELYRAQRNSGEPDQDGIPEGAGNARNMHGGGLTTTMNSRDQHSNGPTF